MTDHSCKSLYDLYVRVGERLAASHNKKKAADAFALGLYYASELANPQAQQFCRQRIVHCDSGHPAARIPAPPLVFAQLLMSFPADAAEKSLTDPQPALSNDVATEDPAHLRSMGLFVVHDEWPPRPSSAPTAKSEPEPILESQSRSTLPNSPFAGLATAESSHENPFERELEANSEGDGARSLFDFDVAVADTTPKNANRSPIHSSKSDETTQPQFRAKEPFVDSSIAMGFDSHHIYDLGSGQQVSDLRADSIRAVEDLLLASPTRSDEPIADRSGAPLAGLLNLAAGLAAAVGFAAVGFFGYTLYPQLKQFDITQFVETMTGNKSNQSSRTPQANDVLITSDAADVVVQPTTATPVAERTTTANGQSWWGDERPAVYVAPSAGPKK